MNVEWSQHALVDLNRFADFLSEHHPSLASSIGAALVMRAQDVLGGQPRFGARIGDRDDYRQAVIRMLNAKYVFQYRIEADRILVLRVFHGREAR